MVNEEVLNLAKKYRIQWTWEGVKNPTPGMPNALDLISFAKEVFELGYVAGKEFQKEILRIQLGLEKNE